MLIDGARAAHRGLSRSDAPLAFWARDLVARAHVHVAVVALAAKLARNISAVLRSGVAVHRRVGATAA